MLNNIRQKGAFIAIISCILILCVALLCVNVIGNGASAATEISGGKDITITHLTDTHYYPFRLGYYGNITKSNDDKFFYNWIMDKSTKLWLEAEAVFDQAMLNIKEIGPNYLVLTGDTAQDGEILSHIDLANKLRKLQNDIRTETGNDSFQVFAIMGNHDLYNPASYRFDNDKGLLTTTYYSTRMDIALIYAGLGYPNISTEKANEYYSYMADDLQGQYGFVQSYLSSDFNWAWEFVKDDEENNTRYFTYEADASIEEKESLSMEYLLDNDLVKLIDNSAHFSASGQCYLYEKFNDSRDIEVGQLTFLAVRKDGEFSVVGMDVPISNAIEGHVLGGQLCKSTQDFMAKNGDIIKTNEGTIIIGQSHHSVLPHWEMEENITTGFILYNWQEMADFMADLGMRYVYTGHMHANDTATRVSLNGNQIVDIESSANVSVGSALKTTRIHYGKVNGKFAEKAYLNRVLNEFVDAETENVQLFSKVYANDKYGYVADNKVNSFLDYSKKRIVDYSSYAQRRVYDNAVVNKLNEFLTPTITSMLGDLIGNISLSVGGFNINLGAFSKDIVKLADNLIAAIGTDVLTDYTYSGDNELYKKEENKVFGFLEELVNEICYFELAEGLNVIDFFMSGYIDHNTGNKISSMDQLDDAHKEAYKKVYSGYLVDVLFEKILDREKGLYRLIEGLQDTTLDLSQGISNSFKNQLELLGGVIGFTKDTFKLDLSKFNLGDILKVAGGHEVVKGLLEKTGMDFDLENNSLTEIIDDLVSKYLTTSFKKSISEYAYDVIRSFGIDEKGSDVMTEKEELITIKDFTDADAKVFTYIQKTRDEIVTVENGKKPSMVTTNFGSDPATMANFTYFTDRRITSGGIEYVETNNDGTFNKNAASYKSAKTEIYGTTKPLIDLGVWCQSGYVELGRHTISLTNLKPNTTYAYRVGERTKGYWSDWYTFITAPDTAQDFEAFIGSDLQSSSRYAYERISAIYDKLGAVFTDKIAFMINPGDAVDNGRNLSQYEWWLNSAAKFNASTAMVIAPGNHEAKSFEVAKAGNMAYYGGVADTDYFYKLSQKKAPANAGASVNARLDEYNYMYTHFNYDLPSAQVQSTGFYYSFDYSVVHFTVLNTNDLDQEYKLSKAQYDWLVADLDKAKDKIKVVVMHKSLYSAGSHSYDRDVIAMRAQLTPLFNEKKVGLVIAGHDHTYTETYYLDKNGKKMLVNANGKSEIGNKGTLYLTMGTMGEKFYNYVSNPKVPVNTGYSLHNDNNKLSNPTFGKLSYDAKSNKLSYYGYEYIRELDELGNVIDGKIVEIKKSKDWNTLISIALVGLIAVSVVVAVVVSAVHNAKIRKVND